MLTRLAVPTWDPLTAHSAFRRRKGLSPMFFCLRSKGALALAGAQLTSTRRAREVGSAPHAPVWRAAVSAAGYFSGSLKPKWMSSPLVWRQAGGGDRPLRGAGGGDRPLERRLVWRQADVQAEGTGPWKALAWRETILRQI